MSTLLARHFAPSSSRFSRSQVMTEDQRTWNRDKIKKKVPLSRYPNTTCRDVCCNKSFMKIATVLGGIFGGYEALGPQNRVRFYGGGADRGVRRKRQRHRKIRKQKGSANLSTVLSSAVCFQTDESTTLVQQQPSDERSVTNKNTCSEKRRLYHVCLLQQ